MGSPKGLLKAPDGAWTLLERLLSMSQGALPDAEVVLLGQRAAYAGIPQVTLPDAVEGAGPIGGLLALSRWALARDATRILSLACDMPHVTRELVARLARTCPSQANLAARLEGRWQPFFARYEPASTEAASSALVSRGKFGMTEVLRALGSTPLPLAPGDAAKLRDWDTPKDMVC
jgi:molybdopterin-guanine dinucleotide biosynthesis protein A